jgi:WD40 repeat protein
VAYSPDGKRIVSGSIDRTLKVWEAAQGQDLLTLKVLADSVTGLAFNSNGTRLAGASDDGTITIWDADLRNPSEANLWPLPDRDERLRYHNEQARLAEQEKQWFAAAFHLGRLLLDQPDDADLKRRRAQALANHAAENAPQVAPARMPRATD